MASLLRKKENKKKATSWTEINLSLSSSNAKKTSRKQRRISKI